MSVVAQKGNGQINHSWAVATFSQTLSSLCPSLVSLQQVLKMTAVLSSTDTLRKDRHMSLDDNNMGSVVTIWPFQCHSS